MKLPTAFSVLVCAIVAGCGAGEPPNPSTPTAPPASRPSPSSTPATSFGGGSQAVDMTPGADMLDPTQAPIRTVPSPSDPLPEPSPLVRTSQPPRVRIGGVAFGAEVVRAPAERYRGLSERDALPPKTGMLFVFETGVAPAFVMRGMRFPLDFVWISADCVVVDITLSVPIPESGATALPTYASRSPASYNLEINGGEAELYGIAVGDPVEFSGIPAVACTGSE